MDLDRAVLGHKARDTIFDRASLKGRDACETWDHYYRDYMGIS